MNPNLVGLARRHTVAAVMHWKPGQDGGGLLCAEQFHDTAVRGQTHRCGRDGQAAEDAEQHPLSYDLNRHMTLWRAGRLEEV